MDPKIDGSLKPCEFIKIYGKKVYVIKENNKVVKSAYKG